MKRELTWENLEIESAQVETTFWEKQSQVGWKGQDMVLLLRTNADYLGMFNASTFEASCYANSQVTMQDRSAKPH